MRSVSKPFNLLRSFSLLSLLCIGLISLVSAVLLSRYLTKHILHRDAVVTMQFVQSTLASMDPSRYFECQTSKGYPTMYACLFAQRDPAQVKAAFEDFFQRIALMPEVVRANVYAQDQTIIWSNQSHLIGSHFATNAELRYALVGHLMVKTGQAQQSPKADHVLFEDTGGFFIENYIPIWNHTRDTVIGVVEVYKVSDVLVDVIATGNRLVWGSALGGGFFLYSVLFWIVYRAAQVICRQREKLIASESLTATGEMASAIAHNIRNPLASIRSSAEVASEALQDEKPHPVLLHTKAIMTDVDRIEGWLHELLTYARPLQHAPIPIQLPAFIRQTVQRLQPDLDQCSVCITIDIPATLPSIQADPGLLQQALYSLFSNALEAMPQGGTLTICSRLSADRCFVQTAVQDTGHGIPPDAVAQVFRPFFTTKPKGLGVGLSFAKRIMERHEGTMTLRSEVGLGTTVTFTLPRAE